MAGKYDARIARGMAFLDEHVPDWADNVDLKRLDLSMCTVCVVGQLIGDEVQSYGGLHILAPFSEQEEKWPSDLGFSLSDEENEYETATYPGLTRAWKLAISARRAATDGQEREG